MTATTDFIRHCEPTVRHNAALAYSQCMPESDYAYSPEPQYVPHYNQYPAMPQQPAPAPAAKSSGKGLLFVAGLAVVGAAAFGGVMLLNSGDSQATQTTAASNAASDAAASDTASPAGSTIVNLPSAVAIPAPLPVQNVRPPVVINNPAPVYVSGPVSSPRTVATPRAVTAPVANPAPAPAAAPAPAPAPAPAAPTGPGVSIQLPGGGVSVGSKGGVSVDTPVVNVGVPGQDGGDVVVALPGPAKSATDGSAKGGDAKTTTGPAGNNQANVVDDIG